MHHLAGSGVNVTPSDLRNVLDSLVAAILMLMGLFGLRAYKVVRQIIERVEQRSLQLEPNGGGSLRDDAAAAASDSKWAREQLSHLSDSTALMRQQWHDVAGTVAELNTAVTNLHTVVSNHTTIATEQAAALRRSISTLQDELAHVWSTLGAHGIHPATTTSQAGGVEL